MTNELSKEVSAFLEEVRLVCQKHKMQLSVSIYEDLAIHDLKKKGTEFDATIMDYTKYTKGEE